jgi:hypothetical protein
MCLFWRLQIILRLLETFLSNIIQNSRIFEQELPSTNEGFTLIAMEADIYDVGAYDMDV